MLALRPHEVPRTRLRLPPWLPNGLEYLRADEASHLFRAGLRGTLVDLSRFAGAVEAVTPARIHQYLAALPPEWQEIVRRGKQEG